MHQMSGRTILNLALGALVVLLLAGVGIGIYNAGVSQGIAQAATLPEGSTVVTTVPYGYGWHGGFFGFGFLWILFPIFFFLLLFGLARAAFGGGRRWGGPGWGPGGYGRDGWHEERERRMAEYHQRLHDEQAGRSGDPNRPNPPNPPNAS
jgi:hypothetical protein